MESLNYFSFPIQSNIYGLTCLQTDSGVNSIVVATLEGQIFCIEKSSCREVHFTYIPNGADIISIDAFKRSSNDFVVGITFVKIDKEISEPVVKSDDKKENSLERTTIERYYFNIYASLMAINDLDHISQDCQTFEIEFVPYHLYHTDLYLDETLTNKEPVWLLSGSDRIHLFREDKEKQCFYEESICTYFPELCDLPSIALWIDIYNLQNNDDNVKRVTAIGCENGLVRLSVVEFCLTREKHILTTFWDTTFDGPVLSVRIFTDQSHSLRANTVFKNKLKAVLNMNIDCDNTLHLIIVNSIEASVVYRNIIGNGLTKRLILPNSRGVDCTITSCIADVDMDGINEVAIGTYDHELIVYKYEKASDSYILLWKKDFPHPLQSIAYVDLTDDGLNELLVLTNKGLHVLQHNLTNALELCHKRVRNLLKRLEMSQ